MNDYTVVYGKNYRESFRAENDTEAVKKAKEDYSDVLVVARKSEFGWLVLFSTWK